jgi:hypothetical protein
MSSEQLMKYPDKIPAATARPGLFYTRVPGYYAVYNPPDAASDANDESIAIYEGEADEAKDLPASARVMPVYSSQPGGSPAVPTGNIFIRFAEGTSAETRRDEIERAGYEVVESLSYAPHAAWLRSRRGDAAQALKDVGKLERIPDVENVEPQFLMKRSLRDVKSGASDRRSN